MANGKFAQTVIDIIKQVPGGKVVSYGQVAVYAGKPGAARAVGWTLRQLSPELVEGYPGGE